jgi:hypothetical protein
MSGSSNAGAAVADEADVRQPAAAAQATSALREVVGFAALSAFIFLAFGLLTLGRGHPEEDAYIMFRYADHVAQGRGIVFNPAGPPAEGATDFLWMIMLSAVEAIGFDVAVGAVVLNAVGAGLAGFVLAKVISGAGLSTTLRRSWSLLAALTVPFLSSSARCCTPASRFLPCTRASPVVHGPSSHCRRPPWLSGYFGLTA